MDPNRAVVSPNRYCCAAVLAVGRHLRRGVPEGNGGAQEVARAALRVVDGAGAVLVEDLRGRVDLPGAQVALPEAVLGAGDEVTGVEALVGAGAAGRHGRRREGLALEQDVRDGQHDVVGQGLGVVAAVELAPALVGGAPQDVVGEGRGREPDKIAARIVKGNSRRRREIYPDAVSRLCRISYSLIPGFLHSVMAKKYHHAFSS